jgi:lysosomal Pro-X carboxypeptidase
MLINGTIFTTLISGSHCLDILFAKETDPEWLVTQRKIEIKIIKEWINKYYVDLTMF